MEKPAPAEIEAAQPYIEIANEILTKFSDFKAIKFDSPASVGATLKMMAAAGPDRGLEYLRLALHEYQPHKSGGAAPLSLAHPYFLKSVKRRAAAYERDLARGQLSLLFVERTDSRHVYGARKPSEPESARPAAAPTALAAVITQFLPKQSEVK